MGGHLVLKYAIIHKYAKGTILMHIVVGGDYLLKKASVWYCLRGERQCTTKVYRQEVYQKKCAKKVYQKNEPTIAKEEEGCQCAARAAAPLRSHIRGDLQS